MNKSRVRMLQLQDGCQATRKVTRAAPARACRNAPGVRAVNPRPPQSSASLANGHGTVALYLASGKKACSISHRVLLNNTITGLQPYSGACEISGPVI